MRSLLVLSLVTGCSLTRLAFRDLTSVDLRSSKVVGCSVMVASHVPSAWVALETRRSGVLVFGPENHLFQGEEEADGELVGSREPLPPSSLPCVQVDRSRLSGLGPETPGWRFDERGRRAPKPAPLGELAQRAAILVADGHVQTLQLWVAAAPRAVEAGHVSLGEDICLGCRDGSLRQKRRGREWEVPGAPLAVWPSGGGIAAFVFLLPLALTADLLLAPWQPVMVEELLNKQR